MADAEAAPAVAEETKKIPATWVDPRPQPPMPIMTFHCTDTESRIFSWVGLRVAGMGNTIDENRKDKIGGVAGTFGTCAISLPPRDMFYHRNVTDKSSPLYKPIYKTGYVELVDRDGNKDTWGLEEWLESTIVHSIPGGDFLGAPDKGRGGWCACVSETDKVVTNLETISVIVTGDAPAPAPEAAEQAS